MSAAAPESLPPNHHADYAGCSGVPGLFAGLTMILGRGAVARLAADLTEVTDGDHVVDVGCGPGAPARVAARRGATVAGIDPAGVMLTLARLLTRRRGSITWTEGTAESLPLPDGAATVVWSIATVHHWADVDRGLAEAHRVLAPGGRFLAVERRTKPGAKGLASHGWIDSQAEAFAEASRAAGFTDVGVETHKPGIVPQLAVRATRP